MKGTWICSLAIAAAMALGVAAIPPEAVRLEQKSQGTRPSLPAIESFDGLGYGFEACKGVR